MKHEPVMTMATAVAAIWALVVAVAAWVNVPVPVEVQAAAVPAILAAFWLVRRQVTPLTQPRTKEGVRLVPDPRIHHPSHREGKEDGAL